MYRPVIGLIAARLRRWRDIARSVRLPSATAHRILEWIAIPLPFDDLVRLDFYYLENWSLWLDITILVKTIPAVVARRGAY